MVLCVCVYVYVCVVCMCCVCGQRGQRFCAFDLGTVLSNCSLLKITHGPCNLWMCIQCVNDSISVRVLLLFIYLFDNQFFFQACPCASVGAK